MSIIDSMESAFGMGSGGRGSTALPVQVAIVVPSTRKEKQISKSGFKSRINTTRKFLDSRFGGDTTLRGSGGFVDGGDVISEKVAVVESSTTPSEYNSERRELAAFIESKRKAWDQISLAYEVEGTTFLYDGGGTPTLPRM